MTGDRLWSVLRRLREARSAASRSRAFQLVRYAALLLALTGASVLFASVVDEHYALRNWLAWRYFKAWGYAVLWFAACISAGFVVVRRVASSLPARETFVLAAPTGVYLFYVGMFAGGVVRAYRTPAFAVALPIVLLAVGARPLLRFTLRAMRHVRAARRRGSRPPSVSAAVAVVFGLICLAAIYVTILAPQNAAFDSVWYHLGLGQQYRAQGGILRSPEGWFVEALPQLAAITYAWAFLLPGNDLFDAMMLAAHMEYVLLLATLASIPTLVRWLVPRARAVGSWAALFLFPSVYVYDASLSTGNDHVAAFWAVPMALACRRAWRRLEPRYTLLFAVFAASAVLTKYQAASLVVAPTLALSGRAVWLGVRRAPAPWLAGLATALCAGLVLSAPHWLKNWIWYGDPFYPALHKHLPVKPWNPDVASFVEWNYQRLLKRPTGTLWEQLEQTVRAGFTFSFKTHARSDLHGQLPIFGSLFTLSLLWLPFLKNTKRVWALFALAQVGVFVWYFMSHVERYLQPLVPWMAAVVAACVMLAWREGWLAKAAVGGLVGLQVVWGADAYFFPTHRMSGDAPIRVAARWLSTGYRKAFDERKKVGEPLRAFAKELPRDAKVLLHEHNPRLGLRAAIVTDMMGFQGLISYQRLGSPRELYDLYAELGITHVLRRHKESRGFDTLAGDLRFLEFVVNSTQPVLRRGALELSRITNPPPEQRSPELALYLGCGARYEPGLHPLAALTVHDTSKKLGAVPASKQLSVGQGANGALIDEAAFIVYDSRCRHSVGAASFAGFVHAATRRREELWIRKR